MSTLTRASKELFSRTADERFPSLQALWEHCLQVKEASIDRWHPPLVASPRQAHDVSPCGSEITDEAPSVRFTHRIPAEK